jgi:hypothetical protein
MKRVAVFILLIVAAVAAWSLLRRGTPPDEAERNRAFTESMSGVTLVGYSTRTNSEGLSKEEQYIIEKISHVTGDTWLFQTRLKYDGRDIPVPFPLTVKWAGDTPVITLTDLSIPGVGTYTARVVLYRDQYAGTWSGKNVGGQLFGKIVRGATP